MSHPENQTNVIEGVTDELTIETAIFHILDEVLTVYADYDEFLSTEEDESREVHKDWAYALVKQAYCQGRLDGAQLILNYYDVQL